jgi:phage-related baseplate assembly protein
MSAAFIDFARIDPPKAIEAMDYESQLAAAKARLVEILPDWDVADIESDPANKILEAAAYLDLLLRGRINDSIRGMLLAYAKGTDLDQLGANVNVQRLPGETDARFRDRVQQGLWAYTAAGNPAAYRWHAMSVSPDVLDVAVSMPSPGRVDVIALSAQWLRESLVAEDDASIGAALFSDLESPETPPIDAINPLIPVQEPQDSATHNAIRRALAAEDVTPLTDDAHVLSPAVIAVPVTAVLHLQPGPDAALVLADALAALQAYQLQIRQIGHDCTRAGIIDALVVSGVRAVDLSSPTVDVICTDYEVAALLPIDVTVSEVRSV